MYKKDQHTEQEILNQIVGLEISSGKLDLRMGNVGQPKSTPSFLACLDEA